MKKELSFTFKVQLQKEHNVILTLTSAMNIQRMAMKMEFIGGNMKSMNNNEKIMNSFQQMAQIANYNNPNFESMSNNLTNL